MNYLALDNWYKIVTPLFGAPNNAAYAATNNGITILYRCRSPLTV